MKHSLWGQGRRNPEKGLKVQEYELRRNNFSDDGNFGFRIQEHIDLGSNVMQAVWCWVGPFLHRRQDAQDTPHGDQTQIRQRGGHVLVPAGT